MAKLGRKLKEIDEKMQLCDMLTEAVEALESIAAIDILDLERLILFKLDDLIEVISNDTEIARETLSKLAGRLE